MYRAVELSPPDRDLHRFVWRPDQTSELQDFRMTRVTLGVAASPYAAVQALQQTATDFGQNYPLANSHLFQSFYVDDCLTGADSPQVKLQQQLLLQGGFDLCKWRSSSSEVMQVIPEDLHEQSQLKSIADDSTIQPQKALGMHWDAFKDCLFISVGSLNQQTTTKRSLVSDIARTFDVLGWLSPAMILMKILFQHLWELKLEWDEEVPHDLQQKHLLWRNQLPLLKDFPFNRSGDTILNSELHGFSDASEDAYSAVVYLRTTYDTGTPTMALVAAKTKVAPLKWQSIPRLELCGAQLLAKLLTKVRNALNIDLNHVFAWSDSTIVLH